MRWLLQSLLTGSKLQPAVSRRYSPACGATFCGHWPWMLLRQRLPFAKMANPVTNIGISQVNDCFCCLQSTYDEKAAGTEQKSFFNGSFLAPIPLTHQH